MRVLVTGSGGLIGSQACHFFHKKGYYVVGIDNDMRSYFFGEEGSNKNNLRELSDDLGSTYSHYSIDMVSSMVAEGKTMVVVFFAEAISGVKNTPSYLVSSSSTNRCLY